MHCSKCKHRDERIDLKLIDSALMLSAHNLAAGRGGRSIIVCKVAQEGEFGYICSFVGIVDGASNHETYVGASSKVCSS